MFVRHGGVMLHPQELSSSQIGAVLAQAYGLHVSHVMQRPAGADAGATVYQVTSDDGTRWWLKCRRYAVADAVWEVVQHLRGALGLDEVVAPQPALDGAPATHAEGLQWTLFAYVEGESGFEVALSQAQWHRLGQVLRQVHDTALPARLASGLAQPGFDDDTAVERVGSWLQRGDERWPISDALAEEYRRAWRQRQARVAEVWQHCVALRERLAGQRWSRGLCHGDLHAGNLLLRADGGLHLIDWDDMVLAPRERDLMFVGAGVGGRWGAMIRRGSMKGTARSPWTRSGWRITAIGGSCTTCRSSTTCCWSPVRHRVRPASAGRRCVSWRSSSRRAM